jgi:hypothetical protein
MMQHSQLYLPQNEGIEMLTLYIICIILTVITQIDSVTNDLKVSFLYFKFRILAKMLLKETRGQTLITIIPARICISFIFGLFAAFKQNIQRVSNIQVIFGYKVGDSTAIFNFLLFCICFRVQ